jgi:galactose mutarotase-like enzyme
MKPHRSARTLLPLALPALLPVLLPVLMLAPMAALLTPAGHAQAAIMNASQTAVTINGEKVVTLTRAVTNAKRPEFTSVTVLPGRGMEILQITANFPGKGTVNVLASPDLATAATTLNQQDDDFGDLGYRMGAAMLCPYPNRIVGPLSPDGKTLNTSWQGRAITLPANNVGKLPGAERHAMHGLILKAKATDIHVSKIPGGEQITGVLHDAFQGRWFARTDLDFTITLTADAVDVSNVAHNVGSEAEPMSIGWHPYFNLPSGNRAQVRIQIPATKMAQVNDYDSVFPTGKLLPVAGTQYDFLAAGGAPLSDRFYDDNWSHLAWQNGAVNVRVIDPEARYGVEIQGLSPEIKTIQMYSPQTAQFVAIEDQYNFADPFGKEWQGMDTGMVTLKPGQSTKWHVRLRLFVP